MGYVLILGANSDLGKALAEKYAFEGYNIYLADTDTDEMEETKEYLTDMCGADIQVHKFNVLEFYTHRNFYKNLEHPPVGVVIAVNYTGEQKRSQKDFLEAKKIIDTNYTGLVSILNIIANDFEGKKEGFIIGTGSIIGEENAQQCYTYTSAKRGFTSQLEGIKARLTTSNVQVLTANPGYVHTKETKDIEVPKKSVSIPGDVAELVFKAQQQGKDSLETKKNVGRKLFSLIGCKR